MIVHVMDVGVVGMAVPDAAVLVGVTVRLARRVGGPVLVPMVAVVDMTMGMGHGLMHVLMIVALGQV